MGGWRITGFEEIAELGRGAQGRVVLARHSGSGFPVAIKYVDAAAGADTARLRYEAGLLGRVVDPHVARLYRLVESEDGAAIVMEAVDGVPLKRVLAEHGSLTPEQALTVLKGSLTGLAAAHAVGVVHRDYKPANVVVRPDGLSKLIDFGIAVPAGGGDRSGTPAYMAPEQWRGEPVSPSTDVYAATCVFFECLTGRRPFGGDQAALMAGHLSAPPPVDDVPAAVRDLVARGLAKTAEERPAGAAAFVQALEDAAADAYGHDWEERGVRALAGAAAAFAALFPLAAAALPTTAAGGVGAGGAAGGAAAGAGGGAAAGGAGAGTAAGAGTSGAAGAGTGAAGAGSAAAAGTAGGAGAGAGSGVGAGGMFAGAGGKVAAGVVGAALVGGGVAAYTAGGGDAPERTRPVAAAVTVQNQRVDGLPLVVRSQYVRVGGHGDPAVGRRINETLRSPLDWTIGRVRAATEDNRSLCVRDSVVEMTARVGVNGPSLISVLYPDNTSTLCMPADGVLPSWAVTVDVETGRAYTADDIFKPGTLTPAGIDTLLARLTYVPGDLLTRMWAPDGCARDRPPRREDFFPRDNPAGGPEQAPPYATVFFAPDRFVLNWSTEGSGCMKARLAAPYGEVRDLLEPDVAARLPR